MLLEAIRLATSRDPVQLDQVLRLIEDDHQLAVSQALVGTAGKALASIREEISNDYDILRCVLKATSILGEISERITDRLLAVGETLSCRVVAAYLQNQVCEESVENTMYVTDVRRVYPQK